MFTNFKFALFCEKYKLLYLNICVSLGYLRLTWTKCLSVYFFLYIDDSCKLTCENGGRCILNEKGDLRCLCWPSYSGGRCEVNHCSNYCQNGGTCIPSSIGKFLTVWCVQITCIFLVCKTYELNKAWWFWCHLNNHELN